MGNFCQLWLIGSPNNFAIDSHFMNAIDFRKLIMHTQLEKFHGESLLLRRCAFYAALPQSALT